MQLVESITQKLHQLSTEDLEQLNTTLDDKISTLDTHTNGN